LRRSSIFRGSHAGNEAEGLEKCGLGPGVSLLALSKKLQSKETLGAHDMEDEYSTPFLPIEDAAGRLHDLPIAPPLELGRF
jgi:hypothetical protein